MLIPTFSDAPKAGTSRPPRVGAICPLPAWNEGRGSSALHEPHCSSSTSTGVGTSSLRMWLQTQQAHWPTGLSVPTSLTHSGRTLAEPRGPLVSRDVSRHVPEHTARVLEHERTVVILCGGYEPRSWVASRCSFPEGTRCSPRRPGFLKWKPSKRCSPRRPRHPAFVFPLTLISHTHPI